MKIVPNRIILLLAFIFTMAESFAAPNDPPPPSSPPPPPGLPVDGGIMILFAVSLLYGIYKIYQYNLNRKTPH